MTARAEEFQAAIELVETCLREGHQSPDAKVFGPGGSTAIAEAARRWRKPSGGSITHTGFKVLLEAAAGAGYVPDWSLYHRARYQQPVAKMLLLPAPPPKDYGAEGTPTRVLVIPDRHNDPRHPHRLEVTTWIARFGSDIRPPVVIDLGDSITMDSCSRHDKNETLRGKHKPGIKADLDNHLEMLQAFERGRAFDWKPKLIRTRGNHEQRLFDFENQHPENEGTHTHRYAQDLLQFGWRERPFGEIVYINGVGFTHAPFNGMGKPMGGKTSPHRAGALLCESLVSGHTHAFAVYNDAKIGPTDRITVIQAGCALPEGEVEAYANHSPTGWSHGVLDITCLNGAILDINWMTIGTLKRRYGGVRAPEGAKQPLPA